MYVIFEGIDGCGKDTQISLLAERLGPGSVLCVAEPDETLPTGKLLRDLLRTGNHREAHAALFLADRLILQKETIQPAISSGKWVLSSRSFLSTIVYQQDQWPLEWLWAIHSSQLVLPDAIILLDVEPAVGLSRTQKRSGHAEYYEKADILARNRFRYIDALFHDCRLCSCTKENTQVELVDGTRPAGVVAEEIWELLTEDAPPK